MALEARKTDLTRVPVTVMDKGGAQRRDARAQRRDERDTCPRGAEARQVPRAGLPRSTLRGSTPPGAPSRQARISGCETGPDPQPECEHTVGSGRRQ